MSGSKNIEEGTYRIHYMKGCLTGMGSESPISLMTPGDSQEQVWEVKKSGDHFLILLKGSNQGIHDRDAVAVPVVLATACPFRIQPAERFAEPGERDHFV